MRGTRAVRALIDLLLIVVWLARKVRGPEWTRRYRHTCCIQRQRSERTGGRWARDRCSSGRLVHLSRNPVLRCRLR